MRGAMSQDLYLQPLGLIAGAAAAQAVSAGEAQPLAGGPLVFTHAGVIEGQPGRARRRLLRVVDLREARDPDLAALLGRTTAPRPPFAGLALDRPRLMGIVNVTPDSFSDGGEFAGHDAAIAQGRALRAGGADILDIGGESTRPGSDAVSSDMERARALPVVRALAGEGATVSIDTRKASIMREAVAQGAAIINDVSALAYDLDSLAAAAQSGAFVVLMHARGDPKVMQDNPEYGDVVLEVYDALAERLEAARAAGVAPDRLMVDPGIGFGKTFGHNLEILEALTLYHGLGVPLLVGASRKGFVGRITGVKDARQRVHGSIGMALAAAGQGAHILRVHDVAETNAALSAWLHACGWRKMSDLPV